MTLVIAYGNPGRCDDGLGPEFARRLSDRGLPGIDVVSDFQLKVEHAVLIASAKQVVFVDASLDATAPFDFASLEPASSGDVNSHSVSPGAVLALARQYFAATCPAYVLALAGLEFERMQDGLTPEAERNLSAAEDFFVGWLSGRTALPCGDDTAASETSETVL